MRTGRPRKPTALKLIQGTARADRSPENEPKPEIEIPAVPGHLSDEAKVEWGRISQELAELGLLTRIDRGALAAYCESWAQWVEACAKVRELGVVSVSDKGNEYLNPWVGVRSKSLELMHKFAAEFGMTPASRSRISVKPKEDEDEFDSFVSRRNKKA